MPWHSCLVGGRYLLYDIFDDMDIPFKDPWLLFYKLLYLIEGLGLEYRRNYVEFSINFLEFENSRSHII